MVNANEVVVRLDNLLSSPKVANNIRVDIEVLMFVDGLMNELQLGSLTCKRQADLRLALSAQIKEFADNRAKSALDLSIAVFSCTTRR